MQQMILESKVLRKNDECAEANRRLFEQHGIAAVNFMSAPGAGKTSLLEKTLVPLKSDFQMAVIEGDLYTTFDSDRIEATGISAYQITTGTCSHLDARMVGRAVSDFRIIEADLLVIENVGDLVCPAEFDLGEDLRVMVYSVTDGAEKPQNTRSCFRLRMPWC